ncbi:MAG: Fic family protein [Coriobacteriales bacterium]|jgi:Fic family protein|nr:Fic family protein [Coriobacteriales bacterium]
MFAQKFNMTQEENVYLAKRMVVDSIWKQANLEGFSLTFPETSAIYEQATIKNISMDAVLCVINLKRAWEYVLINLETPLDLGYLKGLHREVAHNIALAAGELRQGDVGIGGCELYRPPIPDASDIERRLLLLSDIENPLERGFEIFAWLCKSQVFWDGNKRTAMLVANKVLIENGAGVLSVSLNNLATFSRLLHNFYEYDQKGALLAFLYDECISGITFPDRKTDAERAVDVASLDDEAKDACAAVQREYQ